MRGLKPKIRPVVLVGGPQDGFRGSINVLEPPGKKPVLELLDRRASKKYVYQARNHDLDEDHHFDFVRIIGRSESCLD